MSSLTLNVTRSVEVNAYGPYGQRDEEVATRKKVEMRGGNNTHVYVGSDRFVLAELKEALRLVSPPSDHYTGPVPR